MEVTEQQQAIKEIDELAKKVGDILDGKPYVYVESIIGGAMISLAKRQGSLHEQIVYVLRHTQTVIESLKELQK